MSSYSYMVVPTTTAAPFNTDKGKTLSTFVNYFLCTGQQKADILGYSPLPKNLVEAGFAPGETDPGSRGPSPSISQCHNPALDILQSAPMPNKCMKLGSSCTVSTTTGATTSTSGGTTHDLGRDHQQQRRDHPTSGTTPGGTGSGSPGSGSDRARGAVDPLTGAPAGDTVTRQGRPVDRGRQERRSRSRPRGPGRRRRSGGWSPRC